MQLPEYRIPGPEAFRGFIEGVQELQDYLRTNAGDKLVVAEEQFNESLAADPDYAPAQYYKAIVLTHARKADEAIKLLAALKERDTPFKAEVMYNLAFAYAKTYTYENVHKGLALLGELEQLASEQPGAELELFVKAMKAWVMAVLGAIDLGHRDDFVARQLKYLPESASLAQAVLSDPRLGALPPDTNNNIRREANTAAGIAFMKMGQFSIRFKEGKEKPDHYWELAYEQFDAALRLHPRDVRVLDNVVTLYLMRASLAVQHKRSKERIKFSQLAKDLTLKALSYNSNDQFRWRNLARSCAILGETNEALDAANEMRRRHGVFKEPAIKKLEDDIRGGQLTYPIVDIIEEKEIIVIASQPTDAP